MAEPCYVQELNEATGRATLIALSQINRRKWGTIIIIPSSLMKVIEDLGEAPANLKNWNVNYLYSYLLSEYYEIQVRFNQAVRFLGDRKKMYGCLSSYSGVLKTMHLYANNEGPTRSRAVDAVLKRRQTLLRGRILPHLNPPSKTVRKRLLKKQTLRRTTKDGRIGHGGATYIFKGPNAKWIHKKKKVLKFKPRRRATGRDANKAIQSKRLARMNKTVWGPPRARDFRGAGALPSNIPEEDIGDNLMETMAAYTGMSDEAKTVEWGKQIKIEAPDILSIKSDFSEDSYGYHDWGLTGKTMSVTLPSTPETSAPIYQSPNSSPYIKGFQDEWLKTIEEMEEDEED